MATLIYKCPNCGGGLTFEPKSGEYKCEYCLSKFTKEQLDALEEEQRGEHMEEPEERSSEEDQPEAEEKQASIYFCPSCGAEVITDETTAATFCYYCHNPVVLTGKLEGKYLPDSVIPFSISKKEALEKFREWIGKKKFVPAGFYSKKQIEKMSGIYFPYWLFGCETDAVMEGEARNLRVWRVGDLEYTETRAYQVKRAGKLTFSHLPKIALKKAEGALMKAIFPYNWEKAVKFHMGYLSGFQAERRDTEQTELLEEVHKEVDEYAKRRLRDTVSGFTSFSERTSENHILKEKFDYALLPVWVLTYKGHKKQTYYFAMNGQTGEICGKLPVDRMKLGILGFLIFAIVFLVMLTGVWFL